MLVRSSRYFDALVRLHDAETKAQHAIAQVRQSKTEIDRLRRELQASKEDQYHRLINRRVTVHTKDNISLDGVLIEVFERSITLAQVVVPITNEGDRQVLDGHQYLDRANIAWVQEGR